MAWLVYLAADLGSIVGGSISGQLIRRGMAPVTSRLWVMTAVVFIVPSGGLIAFGPSGKLALLIGGVVAFGHLTWQESLSTLIVDIWPQRTVATVFGLIAAGSRLGGLLFTGVIGRLVTSYSYAPVFALMALLHPCGLLLVRRAKQQGQGA